MDSVLIIKIISALVYPLGLVLMFTILWLLLKLFRRRFLSWVSAFLAIFILIAGSNPIVATRIANKLESKYPQAAMNDIAIHDAIIVLGGGLRLPLPPAHHSQLGNASDRYWYAAQLFNAGKAQKLIISGGNIYLQQGPQGEAFYAKELLIKWGVPEEAILIETESRTTQQNQQNIMGVLTNEQINSVLLVTSAIHMPRAYRHFRRLPIPVTPASADVLVRQKYSPEILRWLPSASALHLTTRALHEVYGVWFAKIMKELKVRKFKFWCPSCTTLAANSSPS